MTSSNDDTSNYEGTLLEDIKDKLTAILEGQQSLAHVPGDLAALKLDVADVKQDIKIIKVVVTERVVMCASLIHGSQSLKKLSPDEAAQ